MWFGKLKRRDFIRHSALGIAALAGGAPRAAAQARTKQPNILFCISDDQTWLHTSIAGDPLVQTPHFDRIAREGLLFANSFTSCPSCAPSRAAILTGQDFWRLEEGGLLFGRLNKKFPVYTDLLSQAGYDVGMTGKGYGPANQELDNVWKQPCGNRWDKTLTDEPPEEISDVDYAGSFADFMDDRDADRPFCFWYGCYEPHREYGYGNGADSGMDVAKVAVPEFLPDASEVRNDLADYLFEVQWFDQHLGRMLETLEAHGELDNTLIVVTSDNGMPFPRAKATAYNYGVHMPLAIRWGNGIKNPGRVIHDFVNHIDFAPTFLELAGIEAPDQMTGRSLSNIFTSTREGTVDPTRNMTVTGLERHVWTRPEGKTYPRRAIHTKDFVYIRNYEPDRWPMGGPDFVASHVGVFGDIDGGPTKAYMMDHRDDPAMRDLFAKSFEKLPPEELYDIQTDPAQMQDLTRHEEFGKIKTALHEQLEYYLKKTNDPRVQGLSPWDDYPFYAGDSYLKGKYLEEVKALRQPK